MNHNQHCLAGACAPPHSPSGHDNVLEQAANSVVVKRGGGGGGGGTVEQFKELREIRWSQMCFIGGMGYLSIRARNYRASMVRSGFRKLSQLFHSGDIDDNFNPISPFSCPVPAFRKI